LQRFKGLKITSNSEMSSKDVEKFCKADEAWEKMLKQALSSMNLSARAYYRILKLSRTIADLEWAENIEIKHIAEALSYRKVEE
jgi:magnesium chelatase family protein